jgi:hypothetical protein
LRRKSKPCVITTNMSGWSKVNKVFEDTTKKEYVLWLMCGHIKRIKIVMDNETDAPKRPPTRAKCYDCLSVMKLH